MVVDQAALYGLLRKGRDLGLPLISGTPTLNTMERPLSTDLVAGALPVYAAASDNTSCVGEAFSEAPAGSQGVLVSTVATGTAPGVLGAGLSTFAPLKEPCL